MPNAISRTQPKARELCRRHFKGSGVWDLQPPQQNLKQRALLRATTPTTAVLSSALRSPRNHMQRPGTRLPGAPPESFPATIPLPQLQQPRVLSCLPRLQGSTAEQALLALQLAVALAVATVLHVDQRTYDALGRKTIWISVTVAVILEPNSGALALKSACRAGGTLLAGLLGVG